MCSCSRVSGASGSLRRATCRWCSSSCSRVRVTARRYPTPRPRAPVCRARRGAAAVRARAARGSGRRPRCRSSRATRLRRATSVPAWTGASRTSRRSARCTVPLRCCLSTVCIPGYTFLSVRTTVPTSPASCGRVRSSMSRPNAGTPSSTRSRSDRSGSSCVNGVSSTLQPIRPRSNAAAIAGCPEYSRNPSAMGSIRSSPSSVPFGVSSAPRRSWPTQTVRCASR